MVGPSYSKKPGKIVWSYKGDTTVDCQSMIPRISDGSSSRTNMFSRCRSLCQRVQGVEEGASWRIAWIDCKVALAGCSFFACFGCQRLGPQSVESGRGSQVDRRTASMSLSISARLKDSADDPVSASQYVRASRSTSSAYKVLAYIPGPLGHDRSIPALPSVQSRIKHL